MFNFQLFFYLTCMYIMSVHSSKIRAQELVLRSSTSKMHGVVVDLISPSLVGRLVHIYHTVYLYSYDNYTEDNSIINSIINANSLSTSHSPASYVIDFGFVIPF